jgi:phosphohistidine phosphatase
MDLILIRHGKAEDTNPGGDRARELVAKGRQQAHRAAKLLKHADILPEIVLTSPLVRARQTADEFCETAGIPSPVIQNWLACGMHPESAMKELAGFLDFKRLAIVGHEPDRLPPRESTRPPRHPEILDPPETLGRMGRLRSEKQGLKSLKS